jgi:hypothetical protein
MRNKRIAIIICAALVGLCAWSPWLTRETASKLAENQFNHAWSTVIDGCGTAGNKLGAKEFRKVQFGAILTLDYQCGLVAPNEPPLHTKVFVSFAGFAFGFPRP